MKVISANQHKYSIKRMCQSLKICRATYYNLKDKNYLIYEEDPIADKVEELFNTNQKVYGTRRLKKALAKDGYIASRRRIARIMKQRGLVSVYTFKKYKNHKSSVNEANIANIIDRQFNDRNINEVVVSDLTYVRVLDKWYYICILLDLFNREIIGYSCGPHKNAELVNRAFISSTRPLDEIEYFHTDRGSEFDNYLIDQILDLYNIKRSLSHKGNPYDNAVAESGFKTIKTEFVYPRRFDSLEQLELELAAYVYWYNNIRLHSTLNYMAPVEYREHILG